MLSITEEIITIVSMVAGAATSASLFISRIRKARQLIKERNWTKVMEKLPLLIIEAEKFINYTSSEKKEYVKSRLATYSIENRIRFDEQKINASIDEIINLTKEVNRREKDKMFDTPQSYGSY